jgi:acetylglutamate kinase
MVKSLIEKAGALVEALPYIQHFRDSVFVIKFGGSIMEDPKFIKSIMRDIVLIECIGIRPVVVHGGGKAITARLKEMNIQTKFINGLRYTCEKTIKVVDDVLHNDINASLLDGLKEFGGKGAKISGKDILKAKKLKSVCPETGKDLDIGFVGDIVSVDPAPVQKALKSEKIPVITPLAKGKNSEVFNINADTAACELAEALKAAKLVFLSDVPGLLRDPKDEKSVISTVKVSEVDGLASKKIISGGMLPKMKSCVHAIDSGVGKVHMIDGRVQHALLLEIFTDKGIGTEIVAG